MNFDSAPKPSDLEKMPKLLCEIVLVRHESALYRTDTLHDLTAEGIEGAKESGHDLKDQGFLSEEEYNLFYTSPAERAKGTLHYIAESADIQNPHVVESSSIGPTKFNDYATYLTEMRTLGTKEERKEAVAKHYHTNEMHDNLNIVGETREDKKERLYRGGEYLIRYIEKNGENGKIPKVLAISHFEIITQLVDDVFGIENVGQYNSPEFGEKMHLSVFETDDKNKLLLKVAFRDLEKEVLFDREKREIEQIEA